MLNKLGTFEEIGINILMAKKKSRKRIPNQSKVRAELQKEVNSICPFCANDDVGHFQIHHIDEEPSNNENSNLILLCPNCHSKITKGDISKDEVYKLKQEAQNRNATIQFLSVTIDSENCGWEPIAEVSNAFEVKSRKSLFPIFNFSFINHSNKTVVMTNVKITTKALPVGLSGPYIPLPEILRPIILYRIEMPAAGETTNTILKEEIEVPLGRAVKFQVELYRDNMASFHRGKYVLNFEFGFNNDFYITIPKILLNTSKDYDQLKYWGLN